MRKLGVGKVDKQGIYRVLETQEKYIRNLYREKLRKNVKTTPSEEMRYLLELGIKMHREGRREKYEMSHYFRAELRTFTENFFKENNENFVFRLTEINRYVRFTVMLLLECLKMLYTIYWMMRDQSPFNDEDTNEFKITYFQEMDQQGKVTSDEAIKNLHKRMGRDGEYLKARSEMDEGQVLRPIENDEDVDDIFNNLREKV